MKSRVMTFVNTGLLTAFLAFFTLAGYVFGEGDDLADQIDRSYDTLTTEPNEQKFISMLIFVLLGGGATYAVLRGIKKIAHVD